MQLLCHGGTSTYLEDCAHLLLQPELVVGVQHLVQPAAHQVPHCLAVAVDPVVQVTQPEHQVMGFQRINAPAVMKAHSATRRTDVAMICASSSSVVMQKIVHLLHSKRSAQPISSLTNLLHKPCSVG